MKDRPQVDANFLQPLQNHLSPPLFEVVIPAIRFCRGCKEPRMIMGQTPKDFPHENSPGLWPKGVLDPQLLIL